MRRILIFVLTLVLAMLSLMSVSFSESVIDQFKFGMSFDDALALAKKMIKKGEIRWGGYVYSLTGEVESFGFDLAYPEYGFGENQLGTFIHLEFSYGVLVAIRHQDQPGDADKVKSKYDERSKKLKQILGDPDFSNKSMKAASLSNPSDYTYIITGDQETTQGNRTMKVKTRKYEQWLLEDEDGTVRLFHHAEYVWSRSDYKEQGWPKNFLIEQVTIVKIR